MAVLIRHPGEAVPDQAPTDTSRRNAVVAGVLFIVATAASLLSGPFLAPVPGSDYLTSAPAHPTRVAIGVLLGFVAALAAPGIAIALYPVLRRFGEGLSLGAVGLRIIGGLFYALGMAVLVSLSSLSREFVDAGAPGDQHYRTLGSTLLGEYDWLVDAGLVLAFSVGGLLYYLVFYRAGSSRPGCPSGASPGWSC